MNLEQPMGSALKKICKEPMCRRSVRCLCTALLTTVLTVPAFAGQGIRTPEAAGATAPSINLPPIPHLDSVPWVNWELTAPKRRIDTLIEPAIAPFGIHPKSTTAHS
jgi:hypothetical protein